MHYRGRGTRSCRTTRHEGAHDDNGDFPSSPVIGDNDGNLYGVTWGGGNFGCADANTVTPNPGCGTIYKLSPSLSGYDETVLYRFTGGNDGFHPYGALAIDENGALFGVAQGGEHGAGVIFKLAASGHESTVHAFTGGCDGGIPAPPLAFDTRTGTIYGVSPTGGGCGPGQSGFGGHGVVFALAPGPGTQGYTERILHDFQGFGSDGAQPNSLIYSGHWLFGTTPWGGAGHCGTVNYGCGTVFDLTPLPRGWSFKTIYVLQRPRSGESQSLANPSGPVLYVNRLMGVASGGGNGIGGFYGVDPRRL